MKDQRIKGKQLKARKIQGLQNPGAKPRVALIIQGTANIDVRRGVSSGVGGGAQGVQGGRKPALKAGHI
jgi:hypothetical protein